MRGISVAVLTLGLVALPVFGKQPTKATSEVPMTDQQFVDFAAQTDMTDANLGQVAQDKGNQAVKEFGQMVRSDHTDDYNQLSEAAQKAGLTVPKAIDAQENRAIDSLDKLKGTAFDGRFAREMVMRHEHDIAVYKREATDAKDPNIKAYAQQALPTLQKHLKDAQGLEKARG